MRLKTTGQLIGGVPGIVVRYEWPDTQSFPDRATGRQEGGRILVAWSSAAGSVPLTEHLAAVRAAFDASPDPGAFDDARDVIAHASFGAIADALARAARDGPPVDVLHILCHGARKGDSYGLALDPEPDADDDAPAILDPARLQQLLAPHLGMLRLVVLAACDSGNSGAPGNLVGSAAQMVHRAGARAVIASRYPLSTAGSTRMSEALYRAIFSRREPLEQGFLDARQALLRESGRLDWASIQLYAREADGDATPIAVIAPAPAEPVALPPSPTASRRLPLIAAAVGLAGVVAGGLWFAQSGAPGPEDMKSTTEAAPAKAVIDGTTGAPPVPAPEDLPPEEPTTGDAPDTDDATTTGEPSETKATVAKKVAPKKVTPKTVGKCPRSITARVRNLFSDSKTLADGVKIVVEVDERGGVSVVKPRSGAARSQVQDKLEALSASQLTREPDALPCKTEEFTWLP